MVFIGANSAGISNKLESLHRIINVFKPGAIFLQETKLRRKGKIKLNNYIVFENLRNNSTGGGLLTAIHENLEPVSVSIGDEEEELLVVEAKIGKDKIRFINGYGPQENEILSTRKSFYDALDLEIKKAKTANALICIEMDSNAKLGQKYIPKDPKNQSDNGRLLEEVIEQNDLIVVNGSDICTGVITRYRKTVGGAEESSVLDHLIVCESFYKKMSKMEIDEAGKYILTKYTNKKGEKVCVKESDHRTVIAEVDFEWGHGQRAKKERVEVFDYRNKENFAKFIENTSNNRELENCFENPEEDLETSSRRWLQLINNIIRSSFKKVRLGKSKLSPDLAYLFSKKEELKAKLDILKDDADILNTKISLQTIEADIAQFCAEKNKEYVDQCLSSTNDALEGYNQAKTWSLMKKLAPKSTSDPPAAKKDSSGKLVTDSEGLKSLYMQTYENRLQPNPITEHMKESKDLKDTLLTIQMHIAKSTVTDNWTMTHLEKVLKSLKNNKARDEYQHVYELFKYGGQSLKVSLLQFFNSIKTKQTYPSILQVSNITSFWKRKGDKTDLENERGIFNVPKIRTILDKLIFSDIYDTVDNNMSSSNIGGRKNRNIRDHLFVVHAIMNDIKHNKHCKDIDIQIFDVTKCFDKLEFTNTAIDLYKAGVQDDKFLIVTNSNKINNVAIKTPLGKTRRKPIHKVEMQGTVLAGLKCAVTVDTIGKEALENTNEKLFRYKNCISIPPLSFIDDILTVSECSPNSIIQSSTVNSKLLGKQLSLNEKKCAKVHIGNRKTKSLCSESFVKSSSQERYLGDLITSDGKLDDNISDRHKKGIGLVNQILSILKEISFGKFYFEQALLFRNAKFINGILCSIEAIHGLNKKHIELLESCDRYLFQKIFNSPVSTPTESFYLETATMPLRFIIMGRRLLFYWCILNKPEKELAKQVLKAQECAPVKNDWCITVQEDLHFLGINLTEKDITSMKKSKFKSIVSKKIREAATDFLVELREKHSKSSGLKPTHQIKEYLTTDKLTTKEKHLLFQLRTRTFQCKANYANQFQSLICDNCNEIDSQEHLLSCDKITKNVNLEDIKYSDLFGSTLKQIKLAKIMIKISEQRTILKTHSSTFGSQAHQP